jgi:hypothetical protein
MAIDDEVLKNYIKTKEAEAALGSNDMLAAIQSAMMMRLGIGIMRQRQPGESGYDVAARAIDDTAKLSTDAVTAYAAYAKSVGKSGKESRIKAKDAATIRKNIYYEMDAATGTQSQKIPQFTPQGKIINQQGETIEHGFIVPFPSEELFKNHLLDIYTQDNGPVLLDKINQQHITAYHRTQGNWEWKDTIRELQKRGIID